jgi:hypothetical protein
MMETWDMFGKLLQTGFGRRDSKAAASAVPEEPPALVIARRERALGGADWPHAKSWLGGSPKLGDTPWPRDAKGAALHFLAQLDLAEIADAGRGRTAMPLDGAFAFFVGGAAQGAIVHVKRPGSTATPAPEDVFAAADIGGDPLIDRAHRFAPSRFPFWPVEFRVLPQPSRLAEPDDDELERAREVQAEAIAAHYQTREYNFPANRDALGDPPLYWLAALMFAERVPRLRDQVKSARARGEGYIESSIARLKALDAGLPPPKGQGPFGDPAKERANSENWLAIGRKKVAGADAHAAAVEAYVAKVAASVRPTDQWQEIAADDVARLDALFGEARSEPLEDYARYLLPHNWREYARDAVKLMAAGPDEAFARLPRAWRDHINTGHRLPAGGAHLMFGIGENIQGNEMFEDPQMRMVLQLTHDDMMYWPFGDNGVYQFWMPLSALGTGDVSKARVTFECH